MNEQAETGDLDPVACTHRRGKVEKKKKKKQSMGQPSRPEEHLAEHFSAKIEGARYAKSEARTIVIGLLISASCKQQLPIASRSATAKMANPKRRPRKTDAREMRRIGRNFSFPSSLLFQLAVNTPL